MHKNIDISKVYLAERAFLGIALMVLLSASLTGTAGCDRKQPIKVGFVGGLTGRLSDLGIAGRNGVTLAVEEVNSAGGINGRPIELLTKDDKQDPAVAIQVDKELIDEGVVAIIGHMTSSMSIAVLPLINEEKVVMISPTCSTNMATGVDDYFLRVTPANKAETDHLAMYAFQKLGLRRIAAVYDLSNRAYSEGYFDNFKSEFQAMGGEIVQAKTFTSGPDISFAELANVLLEHDPDGILLIAGALDSAMICQHVRITGSKAHIISSGWAMTDDFIQHGGPAVEGVIFSHLINRESVAKSYLEFKRRFSQRFGHDPGFASKHSYEAACMIFEALKQTDNPKELKNTILKQERFHGILGDIRIDKFGDPQRRRFLIIVRDGQLKTAE